MSSKEILIVEDNALHRKLYSYILRSLYDTTIIFACDGYDALTYLRQTTPDLVILDIQLPRVSGVEVVKLMRKDDRLKNVFTMAVTAHSMIGDKERLLNAGFDYYVAKPIDTRSFSSLIQKCLCFYQHELYN